MRVASLILSGLSNARFLYRWWMWVSVCVIALSSVHAQDLRPTKPRGSQADTATGKTKPKLDPTKPAPPKPKGFFIEAPEKRVFEPVLSISHSERDKRFHRHVEDYFVDEPHIYFRDKVEFGQLNELLINGLTPRYQSVILDDMLLNHPIDGTPVYAWLSSESFSRLSLFRSAEALSYASLPIAIISETERFQAAEAYTKLHYFQFAGSTSKVDVTFSRNFSERVNFYFGYGREGTDGLYSNIGAFGTARFGSSSEINRVRTALRYTLGEGQYVSFALLYNDILIKPFGGVDPVATQELGEDSFDFRRALIRGQYRVMDQSLLNLKLDFKTRLPFLEDSANTFRAWMYAADYDFRYEKTSPWGYSFRQGDSLIIRSDSSLFRDEQRALRASIGAESNLRLGPLYMGARAGYTIDEVTAANTLKDAENAVVLPQVNTIDMRGSGKIKFDEVIFGQPIEVNGSLGFSLVSVGKAGALNYTGVLVQSGLGGAVGFPLGFSDASSVLVEVQLLRTERLPSLREVFSSDSLFRGALSWQKEGIISNDNRLTLRLTQNLSAEVSVTNTVVSSPYVVVQSLGIEYGRPAQLQALPENLNYSAFGFAVNATTSFLEASLRLTHILNYTLLDNPNTAFESGYDFRPEMPSIASSRNIFYIPKWFGNASLFYRGILFDGALKLKAGLYGFFMSPFSMALQNDERRQMMFFNVIREDGAIMDRNLQFGVQPATGRLDFQLWANVGSGTIFFSFENLLDVNFFRAPFFPQVPRTFRLGVSWEIMN